MKTKAAFAGKTGKCLKCGRAVVVPYPTTAEPQAAQVKREPVSVPKPAVKARPVRVCTARRLRSTRRKAVGRVPFAKNKVVVVSAIVLASLLLGYAVFSLASSSGVLGSYAPYAKMRGRLQVFVQKRRRELFRQYKVESPQQLSDDVAAAFALELLAKIDAAIRDTERPAVFVDEQARKWVRGAVLKAAPTSSPGFFGGIYVDFRINFTAAQNMKQGCESLVVLFLDGDGGVLRRERMKRLDEVVLAGTLGVIDARVGSLDELAKVAKIMISVADVGRK